MYALISVVIRDSTKLSQFFDAESETTAAYIGHDGDINCGFFCSSKANSITGLKLFILLSIKVYKPIQAKGHHFRWVCQVTKI